jgi:hypothetical protein
MLFHTPLCVVKLANQVNLGDAEMPWVPNPIEVETTRGRELASLD